MSNKKENLEKLKKLCQELSDRDEQLKMNASALWDILDAVNSAREELLTVSGCGPENDKKIKSSLSKLDDALLTIREKGCKRVEHGH